MRQKRTLQKVGRKCSICYHPQVSQINTLIAEGVSFRNIARRELSDEKHFTAVHRHASRCLKIEVDALIAKNKEKYAVDTIKEFQENLAFARKLRLAAQDYLADPIDPLKIAITPFSHEIEVNYFDLTDLTTHKNPQPKKKKASLDKLLVDIELLRNIEVDKITVRTVDLRSFALDAIKAVDLCLDKFAKLGGLYQDNKANQAEIERIGEAVAAYLQEYPEANREVVIRAFAEGRKVPAAKVQEFLEREN